MEIDFPTLRDSCRERGRNSLPAKQFFCYRDQAVWLEPEVPLEFFEEAYVGIYSNDLFGEIEVAAKHGGLVLLLGPKKDAFLLRHFDRDVFTYQPVGENAQGLSAVTFAVGADKKATRVVIENLDVQGQGSFTRKAANN
jgi:hypothetical protein